MIGTRAWLGLALIVLGLAGTMALLIALARTPYIKPFLDPEYFRVALIAHVDLMMVVWYLLMPIVLWRHLGLLGGKWERLSYYLAIAGITGIIVPAVAGAGAPVTANYIPFLVQPVFLAGLAIFLAGVGVAAGQAVSRRSEQSTPQALGGVATATCVLGSLAAMIIMIARVGFDAGLPLTDRISLIVWVGGHLLQFAYTANMLTAWGLLLNEAGSHRSDLRRLFSLIRFFPVGVAIGLVGAAVLSLDVLSGTRFMWTLYLYALGIPAALALVLAFRMWLGSRGARGEGLARRAAVGAGLLVFSVGGAIPLLTDLRRQTTLVPAHYHGVLTAVALAFMGLTYLILAREGIRLPRPRWAALQPYLYSLGVAVLIAGMAWAGVNDAPRKTPGAAFTDDPATLAALSVLGLGGVLAVLGGAAYVLNAGLAVYRWVGAPALVEEEGQPDDIEG